MKDDRHFREASLSPARQAWLMLVVIAPMAACYPAIKAGLEFSHRHCGSCHSYGRRIHDSQDGLPRFRLWREKGKLNHEQ